MSCVLNISMIFSAKMCVYGCVLLLFLVELFTYLAGAVEEHLIVDPTLGERMAIHFDVSFHALRCKGMAGALYRLVHGAARAKQYCTPRASHLLPRPTSQM